MTKTNALALDVGGRRIGMAVGDSEMKIPRILPTIENNEKVFDQLLDIVTYEGVDTIVVGYPRNLSGTATEQTKITEDFVTVLQQHIDIPIQFQDETLTSVKAEEILRQRGKPYEKGDIDAESAAIILQDYLEQ